MFADDRDGKRPSISLDGDRDTETVSDPVVERAVAAVAELIGNARSLGSMKTGQQVALVSAVPRLKALAAEVR